MPWLATQTAILLGRILLDLGDRPGARLKVAEAGRQLNRLLTEGVLRRQHEQLADLARRGGRSGVPSAMTYAAEMRVMDLLPTHLTLGEIGEELHVSRNTVKCQVAADLPQVAVADPYRGRSAGADVRLHRLTTADARAAAHRRCCLISTG